MKATSDCSAASRTTQGVTYLIDFGGGKKQQKIIVGYIPTTLIEREEWIHTACWPRPACLCTTAPGRFTFTDEVGLIVTVISFRVLLAVYSI